MKMEMEDKQEEEIERFKRDIIIAHPAHAKEFLEALENPIDEDSISLKPITQREVDQALDREVSHRDVDDALSRLRNFGFLLEE